MQTDRRPAVILLLPFGVMAIAILVVWDMSRKQEAREKSRPAFGLNISSVRPASGHAKPISGWRPMATTMADPHAQLDHAKELCRYARSDRSLYPTAQEEFLLAFEELSPSPEAEEALYLRCRTMGLLGEGKLKESVEAYEQFLDRFPEGQWAAKACYDLGFTLDVGLKDSGRAKEYYRRTVTLAPQDLIGILAAQKLQGIP